MVTKSEAARRRNLAKGGKGKDAYAAARYEALLSGDLPVSELTDKELKRQRIAREDGTFPNGTPPKIPGNIKTQMTSEIVKRAVRKLNNYGGRAVGILIELAETAENEQVRLNAAKFALDHAIGKPAEHVKISAEDPWDAVINNVLDEERDEPTEPRERENPKGRRTRPTKAKAD